MLCLRALNGLNDYAEISTRYKASHVRLMLWWLARKTQETADSSDDDVLQVLATTCWGLQRCNEILSEAGLILSTEEGEEASKCLVTFNRGFAWLALYFSDTDLLLFKVRPKNHYLMHVASNFRTLRLNELKLFATFGEESFLGKIKSIATQVHGKTMTQRVFQRYALCLAVTINRFKANEATRP